MASVSICISIWACMMKVDLANMSLTNISGLDGCCVCDPNSSGSR